MEGPDRHGLRCDSVNWLTCSARDDHWSVINFIGAILSIIWVVPTSIMAFFGKVSWWLMVGGILLFFLSASTLWAGGAWHRAYIRAHPERWKLIELEQRYRHLRKLPDLAFGESYDARLVRTKAHNQFIGLLRRPAIEKARSELAAWKETSEL